LETPELTTHVAANGLRMVHRYVPGHTEFCGVTALAGSRFELTPEQYGLAHFVEHTIFKGTPRRSPAYVINRMESVGGEINAFTTKEEITLYSAMPAGNVRRATELMAELVIESSFPQRPVDREREVIADEIDSYLDTPSEAVYDLFDEMAFAGHPMAHNILGTKESVAAITADMCMEFLHTRFSSPNMVYFYLGPTPPKQVFAIAEKAFAMLPTVAPTAPVEPIRLAPAQQKVIDRNAHQSHTVMAAPIPGITSPNRYVTALAVNILGGPGMNSWLNVALREKRGLVYSVDASTALFTDGGMMNIYFGCDHEDQALCAKLCSEQLQRLAGDTLPAAKLEQFKRQYLGQVTLGHDNKENVAISTGRALLHGLDLPRYSRTVELINAITPQQLRAAAERMAVAPERSLTLC
jgi:predicted Zn-dependent peptidase